MTASNDLPIGANRRPLWGGRRPRREMPVLLSQLRPACHRTGSTRPVSIAGYCPVRPSLWPQRARRSPLPGTLTLVAAVTSCCARALLERASPAQPSGIPTSQSALRAAQSRSGRCTDCVVRPAPSLHGRRCRRYRPCGCRSRRPGPSPLAGSGTRRPQGLRGSRKGGRRVAPWTGPAILQRSTSTRR